MRRVQRADDARGGRDGSAFFDSTSQEQGSNAWTALGRLTEHDLEFEFEMLVLFLPITRESNSRLLGSRVTGEYTVAVRMR